MSLLRAIARGVRRLVRRETAEQDLDDEVRHYLELSARAHERTGHSPIEAARAARLELGGIEAVKHDVRRAGWESAVESFLRDVRYAARTLARQPGYTLIIVLALALGIGANSAIFTVVDAVLLRSLPFREPDRLVTIVGQKPAAGLTEMSVSPGNIQAWQEQARSLQAVAGYTTASSTVTGGVEPERLDGARVTANLFDLLGQRPLLGRTIGPDEASSGNDRVLVLGHDLWQRRFGADSGVVGRSLTLDHETSYTIIGVMPPGARFPEQAEFWIPLVTRTDDPHGMRYISVVARLAPDATMEQLRTELATIDDRLRASFPSDYEGWNSAAMTLHDSMVGSVRTALFVLLGAVGFVLLIACANVANLLLARGSTRLREMAVRSAIGASRKRLLRQLLTESALLALLGSSSGLVLAWLGVRGLLALDPPNVPRLENVVVDVRILMFTLGTAVAVGVLFGLAPAFRLSRTDVSQALKNGAPGLSRRGGAKRAGPRGALVVAQTALAVVLLTGAALMVLSFRNLRRVDLGFDPRNVVVVRVAPAVARLGKNPRMDEYYGRLVDSIAATPGVVAAAATSTPPLAGAWMQLTISLDGVAERERAERQTFLTAVTPNYFQTIGARLLAGRGLTDADREGSVRVAVVNQAFARTHFGGASPLGHRFTIGGQRPETYQIVGLVNDINQFGVEIPVESNAYLSYRQQRAGSMAIVARSSRAPAPLLAELKERARIVDPFAPVTRLQTMDDAVSRAVALPRFYTLLLAIFAGVAVAMAAIGLYGVMSYSVSRRSYEIGLRLSLGATPAHIRRMVVGQGVALSATGLMIGLATAFALTRVMSKLLFGVSATDPSTFVAIPLLLAAIGVLASWLPARRATRIDPMTNLRNA
jgi:putative ABC transport system permease protein